MCCALKLKVPTERLTELPYSSVLCYPKSSEADLKKRLRELQKLGVTALEFIGEKQVLDLLVLGKGCVGIVALAYADSIKVALKIRRVDADRLMMRHEANMLEKANAVHVGPELLKVSKNFLLMQFIDGRLLPEWLGKRREKARIRRVLREVLEQCWRLDNAGLDHGELSHAPKHVIVDRTDGVSIVDFETASVNRKPANVTSICQFLFISGLAEEVAAKLGERNKKAVIEASRAYKNDRSRVNFEKVLEACGL